MGSFPAGVVVMGYYTNYSLDIYGEPEAIKKCEDDIRASLSDDIAVPLIDYGYVEEIKWYDWQACMSAIAKRNPDVIIVLSGDGEDNLDVWQGEAKAISQNTMRLKCPNLQNLFYLTKNKS